MAVEKEKKRSKVRGSRTRSYDRPTWVKTSVNSEQELCPDCFRVVGVESRYKLVCFLGQSKKGMTVTSLTAKLKLTQPTITHHLNILKSVDAVGVVDRGRERVYTLNREAHCFDECKIPF